MKTYIKIIAFIMVVLTIMVLCPPIGIIGLFLYILKIWKEPSVKQKNNMVYFIYLSAFIFILVGSPLVFWLSMLKFGFSYPFYEEPVLTTITFLEIVIGSGIGISIFINKHKRKNANNNENKED